MKNNTYTSLTQEHRTRFERVLEHWLPTASTHPARLHDAMRYSALAGGKRIRPVLVYAVGAALHCPAERLDGPACAVELIHAYSLVHDDLPAMDDDDLRRGRPTCHKAYDEATAILVGDALQSLAFYVLAHDPQGTPDSQARLRMIETLALASGSRGMVGGQAIDLGAVGQQLDLPQLEDMHIHKTGALIRASVRLGALAAGADAATQDKLDRYAKCIGLAFQIQDDILDVEGDTEALGKTQGADAERGKPTYPALLGLDEAKLRAQRLTDDALQSLEGLGPEADTLRGIAHYIINRDH
ncbi:(2E,6E)-farnesyl diphosphate synthase [Alkalilimnicola ehrlichii]|uniref:(2E,6E)-farnesyl diphosphate synthase n=1 Tax=Alkalilimnicola ehrlichii TaxID=351052 RepID=A0A3E0X0B8_9GAMM|nr:farnesyl diphosphate synthase [Alkalilimnicola ehrlichii]RFA30911.1 (2E,6E)-farnesyl diphosphate synthase [Alkalilimnicola ehrlichii]RFA38862.1 (2E,6E)-farnesyl diphosphate synthase [Alkalilimnicola ehrlichii]